MNLELLESNTPAAEITITEQDTLNIFKDLVNDLRVLANRHDETDQPPSVVYPVEIIS